LANAAEGWVCLLSATEYRRRNVGVTTLGVGGLVAWRALVESALADA
jgi:hypothetical protein